MTNGQTCSQCHYWHREPPAPVQIGPKEQRLIIQENLAAAKAADLGRPATGGCRRYPPALTLIVTPQGLAGPVALYQNLREDFPACGEFKGRVET